MEVHTYPHPKNNAKSLVNSQNTNFLTTYLVSVTMSSVAMGKKPKFQRRNQSTNHNFKIIKKNNYSNIS